MTSKDRHFRFAHQGHEIHSRFLSRLVSPLPRASLQPPLDPPRLSPSCRAQFHVEAQTQFPLATSETVADCLS